MHCICFNYNCTTSVYFRAVIWHMFFVVVLYLSLETRTSPNQTAMTSIYVCKNDDVCSCLFFYITLENSIQKREKEKKKTNTTFCFRLYFEFGSFNMFTSSAHCDVALFTCKRPCHIYTIFTTSIFVLSCWWIAREMNSWKIKMITKWFCVG